MDFLRLLILKRIIESNLLKWKNNTSRKPLILRGARQVGKTFSLQKFGKENFPVYHYIDLERNPELKEIFKRNKVPQRIISELEIFLGRRINLDTDLLVIDEIQNAPEALASLRYFYEEIPELHLIAAGSLLEFALNQISFPVGRVEIISMHPMNFYEFLIAAGQQVLAEELCNYTINSQSYHEFALEELRKYFFVGGMPECVRTFVETESFIEVQKIQNNLLEAFKQDFSKYSGRADKRCLLEVLISIAKNVGKQTKYTSLTDNFSIPTIKNAYDLLQNAKVITHVFNSDPSGLPLGVSNGKKSFKAIFLDIGLMNRATDLNINIEIINMDLLSIYEGALAEQFVGQELLANGNSALYFWTRNSKNSTAEIDYLISQNNKIIPIEVKSGPAGKLKSMHLILQAYNKIENGIVLSTQNYAELKDQKLKFIPIYSAGCLNQ